MKTEQILLKENGEIPNNPQLPLVIYKDVRISLAESDVKQRLDSNKWAGAWTNGIFDYHHYHSVSHEVLVVIKGKATVIFGGPGGTEIDVEKGDAVVIPAGVGHLNKSSSPDFKVVGAYPKGQEDYDICTEDDDLYQKKENVSKVSFPQADPIVEKDGPLMKLWKKH